MVVGARLLTPVGGNGGLSKRAIGDGPLVVPKRLGRGARRGLLGEGHKLLICGATWRS